MINQSIDYLCKINQCGLWLQPECSAPLSQDDKMRILHLSDDGLPDWRVEKSALTAKKNGHEVFFGGRLNQQ